MKRIFYLLFIFLFIQSVSFADNDDNTVVLDVQDDAPVENIQKGSVNFNSADVKYVPNSREKEYETLLYKDVDKLQPQKQSASKKVEKQVLKDTSVGASYSTSEKSGKLNDTVSIYSKYQKEHFGITTSYSQARDKIREQGAAGGTVSVAPEVSFNKHLKLKNVYSENMSNNQQKSEVVLSVRPFNDDRLDLDLGAGETFSNTNEPAKSQINASAKIRF